MSTENILSRLGELPSLPAVYFRAREVLDDPNGSLDTLARVLSKEPSLTARLLRIANSAYYGFPSRIETVQRALTIIGAEEIRNLILVTSVMSAFRDLPLGAVSMRSFWEHSVACAIAAGEISRHGAALDPGTLYVAGLLHDIGRLPLFILEPRIMGEILRAHWEKRGHLWVLERETLGVTHAEVGARLMSDWKLPRVFHDTALQHHGGDGTGDYTAAAAIVHVADVIVNGMRLGSSGTRWVPELDDAAWQTTGLRTEELDGIVNTVAATAAEITAAFIGP